MKKKGNYIEIQDVWNATNGGLDIITAYYPAANERKSFKVRDEKTASTSLTKFKGVYYVKDFGSDAKGKNAIDIVIEEEGIEFKNALLYINDRFCAGNLNSSAKSTFAQPEVEKDVDNKTGTTILEFNEEVTDTELKFIGKEVSAEIATRYNLRSLKYYITKKGTKISSTESYPIFCLDQGDWQKIYQPKANKQYRFFHVGTRPTNYIFGLEQLQSDVSEIIEKAKAEIVAEGEDVDKEYSDEELADLIADKTKNDRPDVLLCSGDRDALNIASAGYTVIWQNSETAVLEYKQYQQIRRLAKNIYNVPDLDKTGVSQGHKLALQYIDIKTIWLPEYLKKIKDWRGNPCKDATDFFDKVPTAKKTFSKMKAVASSLKFWLHSKKHGYQLNNLAFYNFLNANGYYRIEDKNNKFGYVYIKMLENVIEKIDPDSKGSIKNHVRNFVNEYLENKFQPVELRNMFFKTRQTDENSMSNLKYQKTLDFNSYGRDFQYMFFKNKAWNITSDDIKEMPMKSISKNVWKNDIKSKVTNARIHKKPMFSVDYTDIYIKSEDKKSIADIDKYDIQINDNSFIFFKYLINTSRMFWQKKELTADEKKEQRLHLINKIYSIGYLAHKNKNPAHAWAVFAIDGRESEMGKSFGGSGKSICYTAIEYVNSQFYIGGRDPRKLKNEFLYDGVDEYIDNILIDDANEYLEFSDFFTPVTSKLNINPKNAKPFTLDFADSPKFAFTSNFGLRNIDPSTERRILYTVFSDYYHKKDQEGNYAESRDPAGEFGKLMFDDFTDDEWNSFYNFIALAIQVYLKFEKIEPPMNNVNIRNLRMAIGEDVLNWANDYFADAANLNCEINKELAFKNLVDNDYLTKRSSGFFNVRKFKTAVKLYCQYRGWNFNPPGAVNDIKQNRLMLGYNGKTVEFFYIQTDNNEVINLDVDTSDNDIKPLKETDDVPF